MTEQSNTGRQRRIIAVPSLAPGGLQAERSGHFGHCDTFTLVEVTGSVMGEVKVIENAPHREGSCLDPVNLLASLGATEIVVGGMGARPLAYFADMGIDVLVDQQLPTVADAVEAAMSGSIPRMTPAHTCGGGGCG